MTLLVMDRKTGHKEEEKVYGQRAIKLLYGGSFIGKFLKFLAAYLPFVSAFYGWLQKRPSSKKKIAPFLKLFSMNDHEFVKKTDEFSSFNDFFIRKLKPESRPIDQDPSAAICPADGRYRFFPKISTSEGFIIKGEKFCLVTLLGDEELAKRYEHGSMILARLCPTDYHRFHFPASGRASKPQLINGWLYSVNPIALEKDIKIFTTNKRALTLLKTPLFGDIIYLEIGATNVGSIHQTFNSEQDIIKGEEKGYFEFGASALVLLFEPNTITFAQDLLELSEKGMEIKCLMGQPLGYTSHK